MYTPARTLRAPRSAAAKAVMTKVVEEGLENIIIGEKCFWGGSGLRRDGDVCLVVCGKGYIFKYFLMSDCYACFVRRGNEGVSPKSRGPSRGETGIDEYVELGKNADPQSQSRSLLGVCEDPLQELALDGERKSLNYEELLLILSSRRTQSPEMPIVSRLARGPRDACTSLWCKELSASKGTPRMLVKIRNKAHRGPLPCLSFLGISATSHIPPSLAFHARLLKTPASSR